MKSPSSEEKGKGIMLINHCRSLSFSDRFFRVAFRFPLFLPLRIRKKSITVYDEGFIRLSSDFLFFFTEYSLLEMRTVHSPIHEMQHSSTHFVGKAGLDVSFSVLLLLGSLPPMASEKDLVWVWEKEEGRE